MAEAYGRSIANAGKRLVEHAAKRAKPAAAEVHHHPVVERKEHGHKFLNKKTASKKPFSFEPRPTC
jgi:carboxypeptidase D